MPNRLQFQDRPKLSLKSLKAPAPQPPRPGQDLVASSSMLKLLIARCPNSLSGDKPRPLAIGIAEDFAAAAPDLDPVAITAALQIYCSQVAYHRAIVRCSCRIDAGGAVVGFVSRRAKLHALAQLAEMAGPKP